jgi:hypothetical protein
MDDINDIDNIDDIDEDDADGGNAGSMQQADEIGDERLGEQEQAAATPSTGSEPPRADSALPLENAAAPPAGLQPGCTGLSQAGRVSKGRGKRRARQGRRWRGRLPSERCPRTERACPAGTTYPGQCRRNRPSARLAVNTRAIRESVQRGKATLGGGVTAFRAMFRSSGAGAKKLKIRCYLPCSQFATGLWPNLQGTKLLLLCGRVGGTKGR